MTEDIKVEIKDQEAAPSLAPRHNTSRSANQAEFFSVSALMDRAQDQSTNAVDYTVRVIDALCCGTICSLVYLAVLFTIPVVNFVIGAVYLKQCQLDEKIPIFLIVWGVAGVLVGMIQIGCLCVEKLQEHNDDEPSRTCRLNPVNFILLLFILIWHSLGAYWVFSQYGEVQFESKGADDYCDKLCYRYAFWFIIIAYIPIALLVGCLLMIVVAACLRWSK